MIFILGMSSVFSPIRVLPFFNQMWAVCIVLWCAFSILDKPYYFFIPTRARLLLYIYIIYTITVPYMLGNGSIGNRYFELSQLPLFYLAYEKNRLQGRNSDNLLIVKWISPFILFTSLVTLSVYRINPDVSRMLKTSQGLGIEYSKMGVGGYEFIYFLVAFIPILLFMFFDKNWIARKKYKILVFVVIGVLSLNVVFSNYSTALFLLILGFLFSMFFKKINKAYIIFYFLLFVLLYISFEFVLTEMLNFLLANVDESSRNYSRILEIKNYIIKGNQGNSMQARNMAFQESIDVFFENPVFGIATAPLKTNFYGQIKGFGQHSHTLDTFALFGGFIGVLQLYIYALPIYSRLKQTKKYINGFPFAVLTIFLILITINVATPSIGFAVFFIFPTLYELYEVKKSKGQNK